MTQLTRQTNFVSILVMLEVKWKAQDTLLKDKEIGSFNPCYVGSKMESMDRQQW